MATKRSGGYWDSINLASYYQFVKVGYTIDGGAFQEVEEIELNEYYDPDHPENLMEYRDSYNWLIPEAAEGDNVLLVFRDSNGREGDITYGPFDIVSPTAISIIVSPSTGNVRANGGTLQFSSTGYAADGLVSVPNPAVVWSTDIGSISNAGLFTAGGTVGPATITATAGALTDTATVVVTNRVASGGISLTASSIAIC